ncbi:MAG: hypothetical protein DRG50_02985 [Deltaproteobacteria bacterium]|nr:MAG: hypothetical protein DRG50_02985 [Deltaproteobacteria bacterium]
MKTFYCNKVVGGLNMAVNNERDARASISVKLSRPSDKEEEFNSNVESIHQHLAIKSFLTQMEILDPALLEHSRLVTHYTLLMGRSLGFTSDDERKLLHSSLLHDLGKMGIDRQIIEKKGKLTPQEWELIRAHPLNSVKILSIFPYFRDIIPIVKHHHEWYDGTGYPDGLMGEEIPLMSRMIMVADAFVAMTSDRPYRAALTINEAVGIIRKNKGRQFDPKLVHLFITVVSEELKTPL